MKLNPIRCILIAGILVLTACQSNEQNEESNAVNTPLSYKLTGTGTKTLVFIHGWLINQTYWQSQVDYFKPNYKTLTIDLAGHGQSAVQRSDWTIEAYADDIVNLLTQLDAESLILIGHSMSGNIALHIYNKIPNSVIGFIGIDNLKELGKEMTEAEQQQVAQFFEMLKNDFAGFTAICVG